MIFELLSVLLVLGGPFETQLTQAGENRPEIERAISVVPDDQRAGMHWLITHMPTEDLAILSSEFLLTNCDLAYRSWRNAPWAQDISEEIFFDTILPYANVNERRDDWRGEFRKKFLQIVESAKSPTEATVLLNQNIFDIVGVRYSTERPKADQSPFESIEAGMASCTGLSILLVDACRSVGVPARFAGTPLWYNESGNHSWVEFWDDGWHYTGGAEPTGNRVDEAWFDGSASKATKGDPKHAIFAVTWNKSPQHFPLVWLPEVTTYGAVDVTDRYKKHEITQLVPIRILMIGAQGKRIGVGVHIFDANMQSVFEGMTKLESADANDHLTASLEQGKTYTVAAGKYAQTITVSEETILMFSPRDLAELDYEIAALRIWLQRESNIKRDRQSEMDSRVIEYKGMSMPFWFTTYGDAPFGEKSLWISMHGGGGAPPEVNDSQWENQKKIYTPAEGVYLVPRAPTNTWNLWHQSHIDPMFERLIENMIVFEGVDPNKVYIIGYSAGGDGVYQIASRMADKLAAAGMMAGHPNETVPDGLRNIGFALHVGGDDAAYDRNKIATQWKQKLHDLQANDPEGYRHEAVIHEGKGHWMDREETSALAWMAGFERNPYPKKIVWVQDDVLHHRMYWLGVDEPKKGVKIVASIEGQTITIHETDVSTMTVYLNDEMLDVDKRVFLKYGDRVLGAFELSRSIDTIESTMRDQKDYYSVTLSFKLPDVISFN